MHFDIFHKPILTTAVRTTPHAYLDANAIFEAAQVDNGAARLVASLTARGLRPAVGDHVIFELIKAADPRRTQHAVSGSALFQALLAIAPDVTPFLVDLAIVEIAALRTDYPQYPGRVRAFDAFFRMEEVRRFAAGDFPEEAIAAIDRFTKGMVADRARASRLVRRGGARLRPAKLKDVGRLHQHYLSSASMPEQLLTRVPFAIEPPLDISEARSILADPLRFPAINAVMRSDLYIEWIYRRAATWKDDKYHDSRHLCNAVYCSHFVTAESGLRTRASFIAPHLTLLDPAKLL